LIERLHSTHKLFVLLRSLWQKKLKKPDKCVSAVCCPYFNRTDCQKTGVSGQKPNTRQPYVQLTVQESYTERKRQSCCNDITVSKIPQVNKWNILVEKFTLAPLLTVLRKWLTSFNWPASCCTTSTVT